MCLQKTWGEWAGIGGGTHACPHYNNNTPTHGQQVIDCLCGYMIKDVITAYVAP